MKYCINEENPWMYPDYKLRRCQQINPSWGYFTDDICKDKNYV